MTTAVALPAVASRPARLDPDTLPSLVTAVLLTSTLGAVSFVLSYSGLVEVAVWAAVPSYLAWTVPVTIDASILVYTLAVFIFRARGESTTTAWLSLTGFTAVSVAANAAHAWDASLHDWHGYAGAGIAGLAPISVLLTTHTLAELIVAKPTHQRPHRDGRVASGTRAVSRLSEAIVAGAAISSVAVSGVSSQAPEPGHAENGTRGASGTSRPHGSHRPMGRRRGTSHRRRDTPSTDELRAMRERGMTVQQITESTGLSRSTVYRRLDGVHRLPDPATLVPGGVTL